MEEQTKKVSLLSPFTTSRCKKVKIKKDPIPRIITTTDKWTFTDQDLALEKQHSILTAETASLVSSQIRGKIAGYKAQDIKKGLWEPAEFVCEDDVMHLFKTANMQCYYCKGTVMMIYTYAREPKQWTLERLDNGIGHTVENVVLACLQCNLRRRCIATERYIETKAIQTVVKIGSSHINKIDV